MDIPIRADSHVHTQRCGHAVGALGAYVEAARARGIVTVTFTDHLPLPSGFPPGYAMGREELPAYVEDVLRLREGTDGVEVLLGIEADWLPGREEELAETLAGHPFDLVIGSVHFLDGWAFDDPAHLGEWSSRDVDRVWEAYFAEVERAVRSELFDVLAHPDLVKKFGHRPEAEPSEMYASLTKALAESGVAAELSTAGLRKPCAEAYPSPALLAHLAGAGVPVTVGSDAHRPEEVGRGFAEAARLLSAAGYDSVAVFRGRTRTAAALEGVVR